MDAIFFLFGVVAAALVAFGFWLSALRRKQVRAAADRLGLAYEPRDRTGLVRRYRQLAALDVGSQPVAVNVVHGAYKGRAVRCFDFRYTVQSGKNRSTRTRGVALLDVPPSWPRVSIVPENVGHKLLDAVGADDLDFESQEFSDRFWVRADDRRFAYDVVHPRMMEHLLSPGVDRWEIRGGVLCLWQDGGFRAEEMEDVLDRLVAFADLVPERLWREGAPVAGGA